MVVESKPSALSRFNLHLDSILEELGSFGKYQRVNYVLIVIPIIFNACFTTNYIFTAADDKHRCIIPECENSTISLEPPWLPNAIPYKNGEFERCQRFSPNETILFYEYNSTCPSSLFDKNRLEDCDGWVYDHHNSIVSEFDLACQSWKQTLVGTINNVGQFVCMPLAGLVSDKFGRRTVLILGIALSGVVGILKSFAPEYWSFIFFEFLDPAVGAGAYAATFILAVELVGPKQRVLGSTLVSGFYAVGEVIMGLVAMFFPYWRLMLRIIYAPAILLVCYFWLIPESIRWLLSKGRSKDAGKILLKAARVNNVTLSKESLDIINSDEVNELEENAQQKPSGLEILKSPILMVRLICCSFWWITCTFTYYGLSLNSVSLAGNMYLNFIYVSLVEIPGYIAYYFSIDRFGRKKCLCLSFLGSGISCISFAFIPTEIFWLKTTLFLFGKFCITIAFTVVYVYTTELFPTPFRHSLLGVCSMFGRTGSMIAPQTPLLSVYLESLPLLLFGGTSLTSGLMVLMFPETNNMKLPDTIEEAENLSKRKDQS